MKGTCPPPGVYLWEKSPTVHKFLINNYFMPSEAWVPTNGLQQLDATVSDGKVQENSTLLEKEEP